MKQFYSFVYLDSTAIDDLFPQVFNDDAIETIVTESSEETNDVAVNSDLFTVIGGAIDSRVSTTLSQNTRMVTSTARKAQLLISKFRTDEISIERIIQRNIPLTEGIFFVGQSTFFLRDIRDSTTDKSMFTEDEPNRPPHSSDENVVLNKDAILVLETGGEEYVRRYRNRRYMDYTPDILEIMMHVSNVKIRKDVRHLTSVIRRRASFKLFVFGLLVPTSRDEFYKISPFAIWQ